MDTRQKISGSVTNARNIKGHLGDENALSGGVGKAQIEYVPADNYEDLQNKPRIEGIELNGNISLNDLGVSAVIEADLAEAKSAGMFKGDKGDKGDTGATGPTGPQGPTGKTSYQYAVEGGYTGTEAQFSARMATNIPSKTSDITNDSGFITLADLPIYSGGVS